METVKNRYNMKFLIGSEWIKRTICTDSMSRAKELGETMIKRQLGIKKIPVITIIGSYSSINIRDERS